MEEAEATAAAAEVGRSAISQLQQYLVDSIRDKEKEARPGPPCKCPGVGPPRFWDILGARARVRPALESSGCLWRFLGCFWCVQNSAMLLPPVGSRPPWPRPQVQFLLRRVEGLERELATARRDILREVQAREEVPREGQDVRSTRDRSEHRSGAQLHRVF